MTALLFAGKLQLLCLALDLVGAGMAIGTKDRERFIEPLLGPGWEAVARGAVQRGAVSGPVAGAFEAVVGGEGHVPEAVLAALHDEACFAASGLALFATASSMVRACAISWAAAGWGLVETQAEAAAALNGAISAYVAAERPPGGLRAAIGGVMRDLGVGEVSERLAGRIALVASAYRSVWLRRAMDAALADSGAPKAAARASAGPFEKKLRDEEAFVAKTRTLRMSDGVERARRRDRLDERIASYLESGFDLAGLDCEDRRRLAGKGVFARDGKLRLVVERRIVLGAAASVGDAARSTNVAVRFLVENRRAIDMPAGESLQELAELRTPEIVVNLNVDALIVRTRKLDLESDMRAAADLEEVLFEVRRTMLRLDPTEAAGERLPQLV